MITGYCAKNKSGKLILCTVRPNEQEVMDVFEGYAMAENKHFDADEVLKKIDIVPVKVVELEE